MLSPLERWLPPGVLVVVALTQLLLAHTRNLTPWKGGGFGMFASTDGLSSRVVACTGTTSGGESIRIDALAAVSEDRSDNLRAMPATPALHRLGWTLLPLEFVPETVRRDAAADRLRSENPELAPFLEPTAPGGPRVYRPARRSDPADTPVVRIVSTKLQWWRITFDAEGRQLRTERIGLEVTVPAPGEPVR